MWKKIKNFVKGLFVRETRVELALKVAKALTSFRDSSADDIIIYVLNTVAPASATATTLVKNFLSNDLPVLMEALELMDASDESKNKEENMAAVSKTVKKMGEVVDETALQAAITKAFKDGKLSLVEAKEILSDNIKS